MHYNQITTRQEGYLFQAFSAIGWKRADACRLIIKRSEMPTSVGVGLMSKRPADPDGCELLLLATTGEVFVRPAKMACVLVRDAFHRVPSRSLTNKNRMDRNLVTAIPVA